MQAHGLRLAHGTLDAVVDATFDVPAGSSMAVIGPNGSGKSTLLGALAGLTEPAAGTLEIAAARRPEGVALVLQATDLDRSLSLSVIEAVRMARYPRLGLFGRFRDADRDAVAGALDRVDMAEFAGRQLLELSGGQRQRILVAQGLAQEADLLLLDEPFTGLDVVSKMSILRIIEEERADGRSVIYSTHDLADAQRADAVLLLATHQIAFGAPDDVLRSENLGLAFGGRLLRLADGTVVVDDPHHHH